MGVMYCSRPNCESIMCDTYVDSVGYVCNDCQQEFEEYCKTIDEYPSNEGAILRNLIEFMKTEKGEFFEGRTMTVQSFFKNCTR